MRKGEKFRLKHDELVAIVMTAVKVIELSDRAERGELLP